ncbi:ribonuclease-domain-containing protein [Lindgomyces ingoldianus]|uniref:Ribonuclease-domain-containing protein n=1 Tax=Lindgomyces ingoldianus TaxID=673940 RepID=A0ACB6QPT4_9PLEO|nr:ribonuclease-domain-containing protein [Lindgomyces ingoldianus]KAF2468872.1 ribonuclease-domain-containing protein [Lindgomyces ingoldianus]
MQLLSALLLLLTPLSLALPTSISFLDNPLEARQCYTTCGSNCYTQAKVTAAKNAGYSYVKQGGTAGGSTYPHAYNNYEGFDFPVSGPYYEFPLLSSGQTYTGGSPGADRVIFNSGGSLAGEITHTGASGNNFVGCSGTS